MRNKGVVLVITLVSLLLLGGLGAWLLMDDGNVRAQLRPSIPEARR